MTLLDVEELGRYWAEHPPVHLMVAAYLGIKPGKPGAGAVRAVPAQSDIRAVLQHPGMAEGKPVRLPEGNVFDFAELRARHDALKEG